MLRAKLNLFKRLLVDQGTVDVVDKPKVFRSAEVFGRTVPIHKVDGLAGEGVLGWYSADSKTIGVDAGLEGSNLEHTVLHELFHAVLDRLHLQQQMPPEFAEVLVENLSAGVLDNFEVKWRN